MGLDTTGLRTLAADLGKASARVIPAASRVVRKSGNDIEADAKAYCPVDTGNLRGSISADYGVLSAEIGPTAEYGIWVEGGTARMAPQPYMGPAFDRREPEFVAAIAALGTGVL
jgi:HK97 gp10 family phage protein